MYATTRYGGHRTEYSIVWVRRRPLRAINYTTIDYISFNYTDKDKRRRRTYSGWTLLHTGEQRVFIYRRRLGDNYCGDHIVPTQDHHDYVEASLWTAWRSARPMIRWISGDKVHVSKRSEICISLFLVLPMQKKFLPLRSTFHWQMRSRDLLEQTYRCSPLGRECTGGLDWWYRFDNYLKLK